MKNHSIGAEKENENRPLMLEHNIFVVWKPEYNLGIPIIDEHHRGIVTTINSLHYGMQHNYARDMLNPIIDMVNDYTRIHFRVEEAFHETIEFPNRNKHRDLHRELSAQLSTAGRNSLLDKDAYQFMDFLKQWWIQHICSEDLMFRDHLVEVRGTEPA